MLKALNMIFSKNPQKLLEMYNPESEEKNKIIQKLWQVNAVDELLEISKLDKQVRYHIVMELLKNHKIKFDHFNKIFTWLEASKLQSELVIYVKQRLEKKDIETLIKNPQIDPNAKKNLESVLIHNKTASQDQINRFAPDEKYLKLKMILEECELPVINDDKSLNHETVRLEEIVYQFIISYNPTMKDHVTFLSDFIKNNHCLEPQNRESLLTIINLINISTDEKKQLIQLLNTDYCYEPEFFSCFTNFSYGEIEKMQKILSRPMVNKWIDVFFNNHYYHDLMWLNHYYPGFEWVDELVKEKFKPEIIENFHFNENSLLTKKLNLTLHEIIKDTNLLALLDKSSLAIQNLIDSRIENPNFEIDFYLKALSLIGGEINFVYMSKQINKRPVENISIAYLEIEKKYLIQKKSLDDPEKIQELVEKELSDKSNLIYAYHYGILMQFWIESISRLKLISDNMYALFVDNLPDLKGFASDADVDVKIMICKLIGLLKLEAQRPILEGFVQSKNLSLQIHAILALKNMGDDISFYLQKIAHSKNVLVRQELARSLHLFKDDYDEITIINLALDNNALVCEYTMNFISSLNQDVCLRIFSEIHEKIQLKNRYHIIELLGKLNTPKVIPIIIELLRNGDNNLYLEGIKSLAKINHPLSITILNNIDLDKNFMLELERAKSLINLGDFNAWNILRKYFKINHSIIQEYAKILFIQLAGMEQIRTVYSLCSDTNSLVAGFAIIKLYLYSENEANKIIQELFETKNYNKLYYIAIFFSLLPYKEIKTKISLLINSNSTKCKTIGLIITAKNEDPRPLQQFETDVMKMDDSEHMEIITAIFDYPDKTALNLMKKICTFQNLNIIEKALNTLDKMHDEQADSFIKELWNKSDPNTKILIVDYIIRTHNDNLYQFIKLQCDYVSFEVQAHIYRAVISVENSDNAWTLLDELIRADEKEIKKAAIDALSKIEDQQTINILSRYLSSPIEDIQIEVIKALGSTGNPEAINLLSKYSESSSPRLKLALAKALGNLPFKDSIKVLQKLSIDRDEYVKVTADISLEKLQRGAEIPLISFVEMIDNMLKENTWKLNEDWFTREYNLFYTRYSKFKIREINSFRRKTILDQDDYIAKIEQLKRELERNLKGNTDAQQIVQLKQQHDAQIKNMMLKEELVISLLVTEDKVLTQNDISMINSIIKSTDEILTKAILLNICKNDSNTWQSFMSPIISHRENAQFSDYIIFGLTHNMKFSRLNNIAALIQNDRAKFYLLFMFNYYLVNKNLIDKALLPNLYHTLAGTAIEPELKNNIISIIKQLENEI
ncbi:MAG TPA: HEAT repeat domain-containing protein [Candidatus Cloacimonadota bacterium]|nr:HEAT repeat domain-containing protein [Candidatus Cloacimonadota bacterium]